MLNNKCFSERTSTCINLEYTVHMCQSFFIEIRHLRLLVVCLRGDGMVIKRRKSVKVEILIAVAR